MARLVLLTVYNSPIYSLHLHPPWFILKQFSQKFQDNIFKFENLGALADEKSLVDEVDDVIVTEEGPVFL